MRKYGIIGKPLEHSYSAKYFTDKFTRESIDAEYKLYEIDDLTDIKTLLQTLDGCNITSPYKQAIMPYLHEIDIVAQHIGAVNVVHHGKGYNTDWIGFKNSLSPYLHPHDTNALVLGTGGASKAVQYALQKMGIAYTLVSRQLGSNAIGRCSYEELTKELIEAHTIIVNCTPLGMYPLINNYPNIPYLHLTPRHLMYDCIYNPNCTYFLQEGIARGTRAINGMQMLHMQADAAWEIWDS